MIDLALRGFNMVEIAEQMHTTVGSVRTTFYRLRKAFEVRSQFQLLMRFSKR